MGPGRERSLFGGIVKRDCGNRSDIHAVEDAFALHAKITIVRAQPVLDPRLQPFLDRMHRNLRDVADEAGLDAALADLGPIVQTLVRWPAPRGAASLAALGLFEGRAPSRSDRRVLRLSGAVCALWALCHGPDDECGRRFARTAVELSRRGEPGAGEGAPPICERFVYRKWDATRKTQPGFLG